MATPFGSFGRNHKENEPNNQLDIKQDILDHNRAHIINNRILDAPAITPLSMLTPLDDYLNKFHNNSSSSSDSSHSTIEIMTKAKPNSNGTASVHPAIGKPIPTLSRGSLSIMNLHKLAQYSRNWSRTRKDAVKDDNGNISTIGFTIDCYTGWSDNDTLLNWYLSDPTLFHTLDIDNFFDRSRRRFLGERWDYEHANCISIAKQRNEESFRDHAECVCANNRMLEKQSSHLSDGMVVHRLRSSMADPLKNDLDQKDKDAIAIGELGDKIMNGSASATVRSVWPNGETLASWIDAVSDRDVDCRARYTELLQIMENNPRGMKRSVNDANLHRPVAAAPSWKPNPPNSFNCASNSNPPNASQSFAPHAPVYLSFHPGNNNTSHPTACTFTTQSPYALKMVDQERELWNLVVGFICCCHPFQMHRSNEHVCEPCPGLNYEQRDINWLFRWMQQHPKGFNSSNHNMVFPNMPTWDSLYAELQQAATHLVQSFSGNAARPAAAVPVPCGYVVAVS
ncbi:hypothetical protein PQX77_021434 [Marasmius sp. AFHP31]|nr:hypothetical protein PQX77_021434 [Marasmius sp. AFHP31]